jgi:hypothetical protein
VRDKRSIAILRNAGPIGFFIPPENGSLTVRLGKREKAPKGGRRRDSFPFRRPDGSESRNVEWRGKG